MTIRAHTHRVGDIPVPYRNRLGQFSYDKASGRWGLVNEPFIPLYLDPPFATFGDLSWLLEWDASRVQAAFAGLEGPPGETFIFWGDAPERHLGHPTIPVDEVCEKWPLKPCEMGAGFHKASLIALRAFQRGVLNGLIFLRGENGEMRMQVIAHEGLTLLTPF